MKRSEGGERSELPDAAIYDLLTPPYSSLRSSPLLIAVRELPKSPQVPSPHDRILLATGASRFDNLLGYKQPLHSFPVPRRQELLQGQPPKGRVARLLGRPG